ncbi:hypothetical protein MERGE_001347 [Pneumocystis wakefieldiae]|uniref:Sphingolipid long chain base-responsive protein PIL1 n=1 Tax=Pneumocystis wakefieldiae TaxID=38082 RepID=A0A899FSV1_9ASCO|nr:hypothetical protein MERGE_001347 [Pneumocystis wakefieldiae]
MRRSYSVRSSRTSGTSQANFFPLPVSSTKANRFFGLRSIGHSFRKSSAAIFSTDLARRLAVLIKMEKNVMRSYEVVGRERKEVAKQLSLWGEDCDDDISDITDKLGVLIYEIGELEDSFIDRYDQYRMTMKSIRNIEASVQPSRDRRQKLIDQIFMLKHKEPDSQKLLVLEQELVRTEASCLVAEAQLNNTTREKLKTAFTCQFDAIKEHSEKLALIAGYGKYLLELLDDSPITPGEARATYDGYEQSKQIIIDCENALCQWSFETSFIKPTISFHNKTGEITDSLSNQNKNLQNDSFWVSHIKDEKRPEDLEESNKIILAA